MLHFSMNVFTVNNLLALSYYTINYIDDNSSNLWQLGNFEQRMWTRQFSVTNVN